MNETELNYYSEFAKSKAHAIIGVGVIAAFAIANPLALMVAAAGYALSWVFIPTSGIFVRKVEAKMVIARQAIDEGKLSEFQERRDELKSRLSSDNDIRYCALSGTCAEVSSNNPDNSLINSKLQELLWTYLKMLLMQQGIEKYLMETNEKDLDDNLKSVEADIKALTPDQQRLRESKESLKETLVQHKKSLTEAKENLQILNSELVRLEHEIQLLRADAIANKNSDFLSAKINASVESLQESKSILKAMSNADELTLDIPTNVANLGFDAPVYDEEPKARKRVRA